MATRRNRASMPLQSLSLSLRRSTIIFNNAKLLVAVALFSFKSMLPEHAMLAFTRPKSFLRARGQGSGAHRFGIRTEREALGVKPVDIRSSSNRCQFSPVSFTAKVERP